MYRQNKTKARSLTLVFLFGLSVALAGCTGGDAPTDTDHFLQGSYLGIQNSDAQDADRQGKTDAAPTAAPAGSPTAAPTVSQTISGMETVSDVLSLWECPAHVFCVSDGRLLLLGDTIVLMDSHTMKVEKSNESPEGEYPFRELRFCKMTELEEEYLVMGQYLQMEQVGEGVFAGSESQWIMVRIGKDLKVRETVDLEELTGARRTPDNYELIDNGTKLIYASVDGFFLYDMQTKERIDYLSAASAPQTKEAGLRGISSFGYQKGTKKIIFSGYYFDGSHNDFLRTIGSVRPDGTELRYEKEQAQEWGTVWCFDEFALIEDWTTYYSGQKGSVFYLGPDGKAAVYALADEYTSIQPSDRGNYFAVQSKEWDADGNHAGYTVRIYASDSGALLWEILCPLSEIGADTVLYECIICEDSGKILLLTCDRKTEKNACLKAVSLKE